MKIQWLLLGLISLMCNSLSAQNEPAKPVEDKVYEMFDIAKSPSFPGGESAMMNYIAEHLQYPPLAREKSITGTVAITFVVDQEGKVTNAQILKDIGGGCGKESIRVVESMPRWNPGEANGHPVKVRYTLPIRFRLEGNERSALSPPPVVASKPQTKEQVWQIVSNVAFGVVVNHEEGIFRTTALDTRSTEGKKLITALEKAYETTLSESDLKAVKNLGQLADYCHQTQFAPDFYALAGFKGRHTRLLTSRADFDANADGLGQFGALRIPLGIRVILYSEKKFKGEKLELNADTSAIEIADLNNLSGKTSKPGGKFVNWASGTRSIKVILPKDFARE